MPFSCVSGTLLKLAAELITATICTYERSPLSSCSLSGISPPRNSSSCIWSKASCFQTKSVNYTASLAERA